jgi:hypothetical protein
MLSAAGVTKNTWILRSDAPVLSGPERPDLPTLRPIYKGPDDRSVQYNLPTLRYRPDRNVRREDME